MRTVLCLLLVGVLLFGSGFEATHSEFPLVVDKRIAVLICGDLSFQVDTEIAYNLTVNEYGFDPDDVMYLSPVISSPRVDYIAYKMNVRWTLSTWLSSRADSDDLVFIFISSHGGGCNSSGFIENGYEDVDGDEPLKDYWNGTDYVGVDETVALMTHVPYKQQLEYNTSDPEDYETYLDDEMREDLVGVNCARLVCTFMTCKTENATSGSCFSGGFCSDLSGENRIIITCRGEKEYGWAEYAEWDYIDDWGTIWRQYVGCFIKPFLGCLNPNSQEFLDADVNEDWVVSFKEAFDYGKANDPTYLTGEEHPVLEDTQSSSLRDGALSWLTCPYQYQPGTIPPDISGDGYVNAKDGVLLGGSFGSHEGEEGYNEYADINKDGYVNGEDAVILGSNWGEGLAGYGSLGLKGTSGLLESGGSVSLRVLPRESVFYVGGTNVGDTFNVSIVVENALCLYGWEVVLDWDHSLINCTGETVNCAFWTHYIGPWVSDPIDNCVGRYHQSLTAKTPAQSFNGSTWLVNLTFQITKAPCDGETLSTGLVITPNLGTDYCLFDTSSSEISHSIVDGSYSYISARYMRGDTCQVNGLDAYRLNTTQSTQGRVVNVTETESNTVYWGIRVWKRSSAGTETEITGGSPVAVVSRSYSSYGLQSATWNCPGANLTQTDSIVIRVYCMNGCPWTLIATFTTPQLNATALNQSTWTVYYWTQRTFQSGGLGKTIGYYKWGTTTYNSRTQNFTTT